jgi:hypothetical protein
MEQSKSTDTKFSTILEIYDWLFSTDPTKEPEIVYNAWKGAASYCVFMNGTDFYGIHQDKLLKLKNLAKGYNISIPSDEHVKALRIHSKIKSGVDVLSIPEIIQ